MFCSGTVVFKLNFKLQFYDIILWNLLVRIWKVIILTCIFTGLINREQDFSVLPLSSPPLSSLVAFGASHLKKYSKLEMFYCFKHLKKDNFFKFKASNIVILK